MAREMNAGRAHGIGARKWASGGALRGESRRLTGAVTVAMLALFPLQCASVAPVVPHSMLRASAYHGQSGAATTGSPSPKKKKSNETEEDIKKEVNESVDAAVDDVVEKKSKVTGDPYNSSEIADEVAEEIMNITNDEQKVKKILRNHSGGGEDTIIINATTPVTHPFKDTDAKNKGKKNGDADDGTKKKQAIEEGTKKRIENAVKNSVEKKKREIMEHQRFPTEEEIKAAAKEGVAGVWETVLKARRYAWNWEHKHTFGVVAFFQTVAFFDWLLLGVSLAYFLLQYKLILHWPTQTKYHGAGILIWFAMAAIYYVLIVLRQGEGEGILWLNGYVLEFIFLIENVFIFHMIVQAFRAPRHVTERALYVVVAFQIFFQMIFYMGLAELLRSLEFLPYILGVWLLYVGYHAAADDDDSAEFDIMETRFIRVASRVFGDRLVPRPDVAGDMFPTAGEKTCVSLVGLMTLCLLVADFVLEIDVTLTKIESLRGPDTLEYLCFSSSAVASFTMPELYFIVRDLNLAFPGLKYGVSCCVVYLGLQMLLQSLFTVPAGIDIAIMVGILATNGAFYWLSARPAAPPGIQRTNSLPG